MSRLYNRAYEILKTEVDKCAQEDLVGEVGKNIVMRRLDKLLSQPGEPLTEAELNDTIKDQFPNFSNTVIKKAAKANQPPGIWSQIAWIPAALVGVVGIVWVANLPYPMIRKPVSKIAPIILLPSYINMDYNYREAIANVEQADQLVNKATSAADIDLGAEKVTQAQTHLDSLPVWFLGYYPQRYCSLFSCSWKFTYDEFERARKQIGRMEAVVFQEKNALTLLSEAETKIETIKQQYPETEDKKKAIVEWQAAIDKLEQIPPTTFAGKTVKPKLVATKRDFQKEVGLVQDNRRSYVIIEAAKKFGMQAAIASQNSPHPEQKWQLVATLWEQAIKQLQKVSIDNPSYLEAQGKLAEYQVNFAKAKMRLQEEKESTKAFKQAKDLIADLQKYAVGENVNRGLVGSKLQGIINQLENVKPGTTNYEEAQELWQFAKDKQKNL
ncbi:MAG: hypothetical protein QNJ68_13585 [Microcoleaceae cyanobacterium MO_207.B10]|nr:hypothetical protein [Microcoleaceae cyanobacterium MO_207.B10]